MLYSNDGPGGPLLFLAYSSLLTRTVTLRSISSARLALARGSAKAEPAATMAFIAPLTAAASAVTGYVTDPREFLKGA